MRSFSSTLLFCAVVTSLAIAFIGALAGPIVLLLHGEAFPVYALSGAAYVFAIVIGGENVLREEPGSRDPLQGRRVAIAVRVVSGISFVMAALHAWSDVFPWLQGPYLVATEVALSLGLIAIAGDLLWRTLRRTHEKSAASLQRSSSRTRG
jgi:hypothetical protein